MTRPSADLSPPPPNSFLPWLATIAVAAFIAYLPILHAGWIWDDNHYVTDNIHLHTLHGLWQLWSHPGSVPQYYPLTHTTFWLEYHLWKLHPLGYHLDNLFLHIANAFLVCLILRRLRVPGYGIAALIFAIHPINTESVAWVTERKNVLSGLFYLSALWTALDVWQIAPQNRQINKYSGYFLCLALFILSLLSKSVTATFPAIVLLLIWWKRGRVSLKQFASLLPFFALGAAMGSLTAWMEHHVVGAAGPEWALTAPQRILVAGRAVWFYAGKLVWPNPLIFIYPKWTVNPASHLQWLFPASSAVLLAALVVLRRRCRDVLVATLFFIITLTPALGFVSVYPMRYSYVADHFQYLAGIGPIALIAVLLSRINIPVTTALLLLFMLLTFRQAETYQNSQTLWHDVVAKDPRSVIGHCNLGMALLDHQQPARAAAELQRAVALDPMFVEAWVGLGLVAEHQGRFSQAMEYYRLGQLDVPDSPLPNWRMGLLHRREDNDAASQSEFTRAALTLPNPAPAFEQLGEIELKADHPAAAEEFFHKALNADPNLIDAHNNLAAIALDDNRPNLAESECAAALAIDPNNPTAANNMGIVYARTGQPEKAAQYFHRALEVDPNFQMARENLAKLGPR